MCSQLSCLAGKPTSLQFILQSRLVLSRFLTGRNHQRQLLEVLQRDNLIAAGGGFDFCVCLFNCF